MKRLTARKVKDGWLVEVTETHIITGKTFVEHYIGQEDLTITFEDDKKIVAEKKEE